MQFQEVAPNVDFSAQERHILQWWQENQIFEKLYHLQKGRAKTWSFLDGPITANHPMGVNHAWGRTYKDLYNRFWVMRGYELRYQQGFDCQRLWVEVKVEKELGFRSKRDIEAYGVAKFVNKCKEHVLNYAALQTEQSIRLGYWMDWNDPGQLRWLAKKLIEDHEQIITVEGPQGPVTDTVENMIGRLGMAELGGSYFTLSNENNYMIWRALKNCSERGWLYRGAEVLPWCPRCVTSLTQYEIMNQGYSEITRRGVIVKFPLRDRHKEYLLVWTTTPWALTSNVAVGVEPTLTYLKVKIMLTDEIYYFSKNAIKVLQERHYDIIGELTGQEMVGWQYDGPFDELPAAQKPGGWHALTGLNLTGQSAAQAHRIIPWDGLTDQDGTGLTPLAPGIEPEAFKLAKHHHLPVIIPLTEEGYFTEGFDWLTDLPFRNVTDLIFYNLKIKGNLYHIKSVPYCYPSCWRCQTELVYRLVDEWFIDMSVLRSRLLLMTHQINWIPRANRKPEIDLLRSMPDWLISKKRFWGLALPIWECEACRHWTVIGDEEELQTRAVAGYEQFAGHPPHRPWLDAVKLQCDLCGGMMNRIPDVGNSWMDVGVIGFSTLRYRQDLTYWHRWYPADWISESFPGQLRNRFYSMLVMGALIDQSPSFKTNFSYATLCAEDGREMHKSWGNVIEFSEAAEKMGVDVMRWIYCSHKPEQNLLFGYQQANETRRRFLIPLWNIYNFFVTYANLDGWTPATTSSSQCRTLLDRWILARLNELVLKVTHNLENYDACLATQALQNFIEDVSNWYIRRSRRRFGVAQPTDDTAAAYATLYEVLMTLIKLLAPITPFVTEVMYQNLVRRIKSHLPESIHHCNWPTVDRTVIDHQLLQQMALGRQIASLGLAARSRANLKIRQPLERALVYAGQECQHPTGLCHNPELIALITEELNVKQLRFVSQPSDLVAYNVLPNLKLVGPKFGKLTPVLRQTLAEMDSNTLADQIEAGETLTFELEGQTVELASEELLLETEAAVGLSIARDKSLIVGVTTDITTELAAEGLARELVRRVQNLRKEADFDLSDNITLYYQANGLLPHVFQEWGSYIKAETLAREIKSPSCMPRAAFTKQEKVEGVEVMLGVERL